MGWRKLFSGRVKYFTWTILALPVIFLLVYAGAYLYLSANQKKLVRQLNKELTDRLQGDVSIRDVDITFFQTFPQVSILFKKVKITDSLFSQHRHPFFTAEKVYARLDMFSAIVHGSPLDGLQVNDGILYLYTDTTGYSNMYLLQKRQQAAPAENTSSQIKLQQLRLNNVRLIMNNEQKNKLFDIDVARIKCRLNNEGDLLNVHSATTLTIRSLAFNLDKGSYVKNKRLEGDIDLQWHAEKKLLSFQNLDIRLDKQPYNISGRFWLNQQPSFLLKAKAPQVAFTEAKSLLPLKISEAVSIAHIDKTIDVEASISGPLKGGNPLVNVRWKAGRGHTVTTPFFIFTRCNFTGGFTNQVIQGAPRNDPNSKLVFDNFTANWQGMPLRSAQINILNLKEPYISLDLQSDFPLTALSNAFESNSIQLTEGEGHLNVTYQGPLVNNSNNNTCIDGDLRLKNGKVLYVPRNMTMNKVQGNVHFAGSTVAVQNLTTDVMGNHVVMNGSALNVVSLMQTSPEKAMLNWQVYSPALNLQSFVGLLQKRKKVAQTYSRQNKLRKTARQLDNLLEQSTVQLGLQLDKLMFKKFTAGNVQAHVVMADDDWKIHRLSMTSSQGNMQLQGRLRGVNNHMQRLEVQGGVTGVNVQQLFTSFNDFGQDGISGSNLRGKLWSKVDVSMLLNRSLEGAPSNMDGVVEFSLKDGALIDYEPVEKMKNFLFKNRDFSNIRFAELKDRLVFKNKDIYINRMEIQSNVLTLYVQGLYSMDPDKTDISIQVPLSNIKSRDEDYVPKNKGANKKAGASIYLRGRPGDDGNIQFKLDLFKKFRKDPPTRPEEKTDE